jgi:6-phosphogluconolactonase (cycloisomerase 2 family)
MVKPLGKISTEHLAFSKDGRLLYGIREEDQRITLFSLDLTSGKIKNLHELGIDLIPSSDHNPGIRFSVAPDGKSIAYDVNNKPSSTL